MSLFSLCSVFSFCIITPKGQDLNLLVVASAVLINICWRNGKLFLTFGCTNSWGSKLSFLSECLYLSQGNTKLYLYCRSVVGTPLPPQKIQNYTSTAHPWWESKEKVSCGTNFWTNMLHRKSNLTYMCLCVYTQVCSCMYTYVFNWYFDSKISPFEEWT